MHYHSLCVLSFLPTIRIPFDSKQDTFYRPFSVQVYRRNSNILLSPLVFVGIVRLVLPYPTLSVPFLLRELCKMPYRLTAYRIADIARFHAYIAAIAVDNSFGIQHIQDFSFAISVWLQRFCLDNMGIGYVLCLLLLRRKQRIYREILTNYNVPYHIPLA